MIIKRILVPVDFSPTSEGALAYARELARTFGSALHVLHVVPDPGAQPWSAESFVISPNVIRAQWEREATVQLEALIPPSQRTGDIRVTTRVGSAVEEILEYAQDVGIDLIVMGTHGRGRIAHALLGSVAERVVRKASCPVLTLRSTHYGELTAAAS